MYFKFPDKDKTNAAVSKSLNQSEPKRQPVIVKRLSNLGSSLFLLKCQPKYS